MTMVREGLCFDMVEDIRYVVVGGVWWMEYGCDDNIIMYSYDFEL